MSDQATKPSFSAVERRQRQEEQYREQMAVIRREQAERYDLYRQAERERYWESLREPLEREIIEAARRIPAQSQIEMLMDYGRLQLIYSGRYGHNYVLPQ